METDELNVVTGAFGYTGKYIARRLLALGKRVKTLTDRPISHSVFGAQVSAASFNFNDPPKLVESLRGASILYNTYWVRFSYRSVTFQKAIDNSINLINAAKDAGISRIVHVSVTNPSQASPLPYFKGKAVVEKAIFDSKLSYAIIRPALIFGPEDILINNIAYLLRRFPIFAIPGTGDYRLQPIFVEDMAHICVNAGSQRENIMIDAVGPETYTFRDLVHLIAQTVASKATIMHLSPSFLLLLAKLLGYVLDDVILTADEVKGLMSNLLVSANPPMVQTKLSQWLKQNADTLGTQYASELKRHYRPGNVSPAQKTAIKTPN